MMTNEDLSYGMTNFTPYTTNKYGYCTQDKHTPFTVAIILMCYVLCAMWSYRYALMEPF